MDSVVVIGASVGGVEALTKLISAIPSGFPAAILVVMHIGNRYSILPTILARRSALPVSHARHQQALTPGTVLVAPPDHHLLVQREGSQLHAFLTKGPKENYTRPAVDTLFRSAAVAAGSRVVGVVLTGYHDDGTVGLQAIKACGGTAIVQDPKDAMVPDMPRNAMENVVVDYCMPLDDIAAALVEQLAAIESAPAKDDIQAPQWITIENRFAMGAGDMDQLRRIATPSPTAAPNAAVRCFA